MTGICLILCFHHKILNVRLNRTRNQILVYVFLHTLGKTCVSEAQHPALSHCKASWTDAVTWVIIKPSLQTCYQGTAEARRSILFNGNRFRKAMWFVWLITALLRFGGFFGGNEPGTVHWTIKCLKRWFLDLNRARWCSNPTKNLPMHNGQWTSNSSLSISMKKPLYFT